MSEPVLTVDLAVEVAGHQKIDFNPRLVKLALRKAGSRVKLESKRNLSRRAISRAGEFPGKQTGDTQKSIISKLSKSGWSAIVEPKRTQRMAKRKFFPTILTMGRKKGRPLEKRDDPVKAAFEAKKGEIRAMLALSLDAALAPR
jgi:hypothetical protein